MDLAREQSFYSTLLKFQCHFLFFFFLSTMQYSNLTSLLFYYKEIFPEMGEITNSKCEKKITKIPGVDFILCMYNPLYPSLSTYKLEIRIFVLAEFPRKIYIYVCVQTDFRNRIQISLLNKRATIIQMCTIHVKRSTRGILDRNDFGWERK